MGNTLSPTSEVVRDGFHTWKTVILKPTRLSAPPPVDRAAGAGWIRSILVGRASKRAGDGVCSGGATRGRLRAPRRAATALAAPAPGRTWANRFSSEPSGQALGRNGWLGWGDALALTETHVTRDNHYKFRTMWMTFLNFLVQLHWVIWNLWLMY